MSEPHEQPIDPPQPDADPLPEKDQPGDAVIGDADSEVERPDAPQPEIEPEGDSGDGEGGMIGEG
ncbi:hypothetical protein [Phenylobacterium immobile]|uniref:hypothetical protein n=1 Tax=Phenylobacterium immobile TaxID=21 RepID=UPI000AFDE7D1|nr:hypothetical protein [Phenylobacterium immobile]